MSKARITYAALDYEQVYNFSCVLKQLEISPIKPPTGKEARKKYILRQRAYTQRLESLDEPTVDDFGKLIFLMLNNQVYPDKKFLNMVISHLNKHVTRSALFDYVPRLFAIMYDHHLADTTTYHIMLSAQRYGRFMESKTAIFVLTDAVNKGLADAKTFHLVLRLISRMKNPEALALRVLEQAKSAGFADEVAFNLVIKCLAKNRCEENQYRILELQEQMLQLNVPNLKADSEEIIKEPVTPAAVGDDSIERVADHEALPVTATSAKKAVNKGPCSYGLFAKVAAGVTVTVAAAATVCATLGY